MDLPFALEGFFFKKVNGFTGQRVTFAFHYIIYAPASLHTLQPRLLLCCGQAAESNSAPFPAVHLNAVCRCASQLLFRGSFSKRSTGSWGQRVDGSTGQTGHISTVYVGGPRNCLEGFFFEKVNRSTGQQVTFTFTILYMIADDARLTPPRCKNHTPYDDTRLTPHHCKKHTASIARSTGKFPSLISFMHSCV